MAKPESQGSWGGRVVLRWKLLRKVSSMNFSPPAVMMRGT
jgi:hypothetical protein